MTQQEAFEGIIEALTRGLEIGDKGDWQNAEIWINNARGIAEEALLPPEEQPAKLSLHWIG